MSNNSRARGDFANPSRFRPKYFSIDSEHVECDENADAKTDAEADSSTHSNAQAHSQAHTHAKAKKVRGLS